MFYSKGESVKQMCSGWQRGMLIKSKFTGEACVKIM